MGISWRRSTNLSHDSLARAVRLVPITVAARGLFPAAVAAIPLLTLATRPHAAGGGASNIMLAR
jgi:hypothetical protein